MTRRRIVTEKNEDIIIATTEGLERFVVYSGEQLGLRSSNIKKAEANEEWFMCHRLPQD